MTTNATLIFADELIESIYSATDQCLEAAVRESQAGAHTYKIFCEKVMAAGC